MSDIAIACIKDIEEFFDAYNNHDWEKVFDYMSEDCIWDASEKLLKGRENIIDYWTNFHGAFKETLGKPEKIVFSNHMVYLQVNIHLEFIEASSFYGKQYNKGESLDFACTDFYELDNEGKIKSGCVYIKFFH